MTRSAHFNFSFCSAGPWPGNLRGDDGPDSHRIDLPLRTMAGGGFRHSRNGRHDLSAADRGALVSGRRDRQSARGGRGKPGVDAHSPGGVECGQAGLVHRDGRQPAGGGGRHLLFAHGPVAASARLYCRHCAGPDGLRRGRFRSSRRFTRRIIRRSCGAGYSPGRS